MLLRSRRELQRPIGAVAFVVTALAMVGLLAALTSTTIEYFGSVLPRLGVSTSVVPNQSLPGFLLRARVLLGQMPGPATTYVSLALQVALLGLTWVISLRLEGTKQRAAVFGAFLAVTPIISSITWDHHLVTELLVLVLIAPSLRPRSRAWWLTVVSYPLLWTPREVTDPLLRALGPTPPHGVEAIPYLLVTGVNLAGMLVLWLACLDVLRAHRETPGELAVTPAPVRVRAPAPGAAAGIS